MPWKESDKKPADEEKQRTQPGDARESVSMLGPILIGVIYAVLSFLMAIVFVVSGDGIPKDAVGIALVRASFKVFTIYCSVVVLAVFVLFAFRRRAVRIAAHLGIATPWVLIFLSLVAFNDPSRTTMSFFMIAASFPIFLTVGERISALVRRVRAWWY